MLQPGPWIGTWLDMNTHAPAIKRAYPKLNIGYYPHQHPWHELEIICHGRGIHHIGGHDYHVSSGDVYAVPPGMVHNFTSLDGDFTYVDIYFMLDRVALPLTQLRQIPGFNMLLYVEPAQRYPDGFKSRLQLQSPQFNMLMDLYQGLSCALQGRSLGYEAQSIALLTQILVLLGQSYGQNDVENSGLLPGINDALDLIACAYSRQLTLPELAAAANMSLRSFQRNFMAVMNTHVTEYIRNIRLDHAAEMLRHTGQSVLTIALACGFQDGIYFCQCFRRRFGMTPTAYRADGSAPSRK